MYIANFRQYMKKITKDLPVNKFKYHPSALPKELVTCERTKDGYYICFSLKQGCGIHCVGVMDDYGEIKILFYDVETYYR